MSKKRKRGVMLSELSSAGKQTAPKKRKTTTGSHALKKGAKEISFSQIKREVEELGASQFTKRRKRDYEQKKARGSGKKVASQKVPYNILKGMKKKALERELKRRERAKERGLIYIPKNKAVKSRKGSDSRSKELKGLNEIGIGKYAHGTLYLKNSEIKSVSSSSKPNRKASRRK